MSTWCRTIYAHNGEGCFLPECFEDFSRTNSTRRTIPCDVCENSHVFRKSRCYENNVCTCGLTHLRLLDDGVIFGENITFVLGSYDHFFSVSPFSPSFVTMSSSKPIGVGRVNRWTRNSAERLENHYYESLAFSRHNIDLVFDEENMISERLTVAPENAGIDPSIMRVSKWYQEPTREDDDPHIPSSIRVSDVFTGTNRTSYQEREPIENDEEWLAMKRGGMSPPVPKRVVNPRIRDDQALHEFYSNSDKMHRATSDVAFTQAWFDYSQSVFPQSVRKTGTNVELNNVPTYQCSILFNNMGSFNRKSEFQRPENLNKPITKGEKFNVADLSLLREFWGNNYAHVILTAEADSLPTDEKELLEDYGLVECHSSRSNDLSVHARNDSTGMFPSCGNQVKKTTKIHLQRSLK